MDKKYKNFTSRDSLLEAFDRNSRQLGFNAENSFEHKMWKSILREKLSEITGIKTMSSCDLQPELVESVELDGYRRDKVIIQTEPCVWMPLYILIPDGIRKGERRQVVIAPHGHGGGGKESIAGRSDIPLIKECIERYNYDYGFKFLGEGYVVFCSDARGAGERRECMNQEEENEKILSTSCNALNFAAMSMGQSLVGMMTWDLMRLVDYIETLDYCDSERIACCGFSGGGLQALWLSAMDERISCTVVSGYYHGFRDSILKTHLCGCNFVPNLWKYADIGDIGAMIAPRPLLIENGNMDSLNGERGITDVLEQFEITRQAYALYDKSDCLQSHVFEGGHKWNGEKTYGFVAKFMKGKQEELI